MTGSVWGRPEEVRVRNRIRGPVEKKVLIGQTEVSPPRRAGEEHETSSRWSKRTSACQCFESMLDC